MKLQESQRVARNEVARENWGALPEGPNLDDVGVSRATSLRGVRSMPAKFMAFSSPSCGWWWCISSHTLPYGANWGAVVTGTLQRRRERAADDSYFHPQSLPDSHHTRLGCSRTGRRPMGHTEHAERPLRPAVRGWALCPLQISGGGGSNPLWPPQKVCRRPTPAHTHMVTSLVRSG